MAQDSVHETKTYRVFLKHQKREANRLENLKVHKLGMSPNMRPQDVSLVKLGKLRTSIDSCDSLVQERIDNIKVPIKEIKKAVDLFL